MYTRKKSFQFLKIVDGYRFNTSRLTFSITVTIIYYFYKTNIINKFLCSIIIKLNMVVYTYRYRRIYITFNPLIENDGV